MFRRHCSLKPIEQHDDSLLRIVAHVAGAFDGSLHSTLTADAQTWCRHCAFSPGKERTPCETANARVLCIDLPALGHL